MFVFTYIFSEPFTRIAKHSATTGGRQPIHRTGTVAGLFYEGRRYLQSRNNYFGIGMQFGITEKRLSVAQVEIWNASRRIYTPYVSVRNKK